MSEEKSMWFLAVKALLLLVATGWLLLFALIMGTFATDSPELTRSEAATAFWAVFGLFSLPAFWPLRASYRAIRDVARWAHRDD